VWSPDGKRIVTGSQEATAQVWDAGTGKQIERRNRTRAAAAGATEETQKSKKVAD
jgi:WD40 repeat protein